MTIVAKRIKTEFLTYGDTIPAAGDEDILAADSHTWLENVTVIGVLLRTTLMDGAAGWDSGRFSILADVSRSGRVNQPGSIVSFCNHLICREAVVGAGTTETMVGKPEERQLVMFPEGYGIDMDEDSTIYLHSFGHNDMANAHNISIGALIFYVER